jgi:hypothetical protein
MSGHGQVRADPLRDLVLEVLCDRRARRFALDPMQLARAAAALAPPAQRAGIADGACDAGRIAAAQRELERVHASELALLLREAASLVLARRARSHDPAPELDTWRSCAREALEACAADALAVDARVVELLEVCLLRHPSRWPSAVDLARSALHLEPCDIGRLRLAQAWMAEDEPWSASGVLALSVYRRPASRLEPRLLAGLVRAQSACGERSRARRIASLARARRHEGIHA